MTYGDVHIDLPEADEADPAIGGVDDGDSDPRTNTFKMMPGKEIAKRPWVTVFQGTEDCYVFVQISKSTNFDDFMTYEIAEGWLPLDGVENVFCREVSTSDAADANVEFEVLKENKVCVKDTVTTQMLRALDQGGVTNYPTLTFTAHAVQCDAAVEGIGTPIGAWEIMQAQTAADGAEQADPEPIEPVDADDDPALGQSEVVPPNHISLSKNYGR